MTESRQSREAWEREAAVALTKILDGVEYDEAVALVAENKKACDILWRRGKSSQYLADTIDSFEGVVPTHNCPWCGAAMTGEEYEEAPSDYCHHE